MSSWTLFRRRFICQREQNAYIRKGTRSNPTLAAKPQSFLTHPNHSHRRETLCPVLLAFTGFHSSIPRFISIRLSEHILLTTKMTFPLTLLDVVETDITTLDYRDGFQQDMAMMHNALIRALNSIYQNAARVAAHDIGPFLTYILAFHETCKLHHDGEDLKLFREFEPHIKVGESLAQHAVIGDGLRGLHEWAEDVKKNQSKYSAEELRCVIDSFAGCFHAHMEDEVALLDPHVFRTFISEEALKKLVFENVRWTESHCTLPLFLPFIAAHRDISTNAYWPGFPPQALAILPQLVALNERSWLFAPFEPISGSRQDCSS